MTHTDTHTSWIKAITGLYILTILKNGPAHGKKLTQEIETRSLESFCPNPNALYPLLRKMEERGYIAGDWDNPDTRNKRVYTITPQGAAFIEPLREKVRQKVTEAEAKLRIIRSNLLEN